MTTLKKIYYYVLIIIENLLVESTLDIPKSSFEACCMVLGSAAMGFIGGTISGVILSDFVSSVVKWLTECPADSVVAYFVLHGILPFALLGGLISSALLYCFVRIVGVYIVEVIIALPESSIETCFMVLVSAAMGFIGGTISGVILSCFDIVSTTSSAASVVADLPVSEDLLKQFEADLYGTPEAQKQAALAKKGPSISTVLAILGLSAMAFIGVALKVYHP